MRDLIRGSFDEDQQQDGREGARRSVKAGKVHDNGRGRREREMYGFVMEQLGTLEEVLLPSHLCLFVCNHESVLTCNP